jgi:hypothetical protein
MLAFNFIRERALSGRFFGSLSHLQRSGERALSISDLLIEAGQRVLQAQFTGASLDHQPVGFRYCGCVDWRVEKRFTPLVMSGDSRLGRAFVARGELAALLAKRRQRAL